MDESYKNLIKNYFSNLHVNISNAGFNDVNPGWRDIDYTPDYNKFYYIISGEGWLKIGDKEYYPKPGEMFLMPEGIKQSYSTINENTFIKYWCHFTSKIGDLNLFDIIKLPDFIEIKDCQGLQSIFDELLTNYKSLELSASLMLKSWLLKLISYYIDNTVVEKINISNSETVEKLNCILEYIDKNFYKNITIEDLAGIAFLHPNYFIRQFRKHLGMPPIHYLNKRRVDEARNLLTSTNLPIKEICCRIGISDIYYFSKLFKNFTGFTPSAYKQLSR